MRSALIITAIVVTTTGVGLAGFWKLKPTHVNIGFLVGITGPLLEVVNPMIRNMEAAVRIINDQGGVLGGTLNAIVKDGKCDPKTAIDAGIDLINGEKVSAIIGELCSGATVRLTEIVTAESGILTVSPSASSAAISTLKDNDVLFRTTPSDAYQGKILADALLKKNKNSAVVTFASDDYNVSLAKVFSESYKKSGGVIKAEQPHEPDKIFYFDELAILERDEVDVLVIFAYSNSSGSNILKQAITSGKFKSYAGADGMALQKMVDDVGAAKLTGNSFWTINTVETDSPAFKAYTEFTQNYGLSDLEPTSPYLATSFDAVFVTSLAIEAHGSTDPKGLNISMREVASPPGEVILPGEWEKAVTLLKAGKDINYEGASGSLDFDENGDVKGVYGLYIVKDGKLTRIETLK